MRRSSRQARYLRSLVLVAGLSIGLIAGFNYVVDPYSYFGVRAVRGFNERKPRPDDQIAVVKYEAARRLKSDVLLLGNSRVDVALDPGHAAFAGHRAYNLGIPGSGICTAWWNRNALAERQPIERVVVGIEFLDFLTNAPPGDCGPAPDYFEHARLADRGRALFTIGGLTMSIRAVRLQRDPFPDELAADGLSPMRSYDLQASQDGYYVMFEQRAQEYARNFARMPRALYAPGEKTSLEFNTLRAMVRQAIARGERLDLVIYPYHAELLLLFRASGLWPLFEDWKRGVVAVVDEETRASGAGRVRLWDFSGLATYQIEPIPPPGDHSSVTHWYWEAGHFKQSLGDILLTRLSASVQADGADECRSFGARLDATNVDRCLADQRARLESMAAAERTLAAHVEQLAAAARGP